MIPRRVESIAETRLLILAGAPEDAELVKGALRKTGLGFQSKQVDSESAFARALTEFAPTLVLVGSKGPHYSARTALDHVRRTHPEIPVIVLADSSEAAAAELLQAGAQEVVLKGDIPKDGAGRLARAFLQALAWEAGRRKHKEAEQALRQCEFRYRRLFETAKDGILLIDAEAGRIADINQRVIDLLGYPREEYLGKVLWNVAPFKGSTAAKVAFAELREKRYLHCEELPLETKDGRRIAVELVCNAYPEGDRTLMQCNIRDISERRLADARIMESEAQFRALVEQQIAGIYIARDDGTLAYVNPHFAEMFGYTSAEVIGRPLLDFVPDAEKVAVAASLRALKAGKAKSNQMALAIKRKNGGTADILAHRALAAYEGRPAIVGVALDITERKRMEEDLRLSEERFRLLIEEAPDAILVYDADRDRFVGANRTAERLFGCGRDELLRLGPRHFYAPEQPDGRLSEGSFAEHTERALAGAETFFERRIHNAKGKDLLCEVRLVRLPSLEGRLIRASFVDISERKQAEQALRRSMEGTIQALAGTIELRDPYTAGHHRRTATLAVAMAREMGLSEAQIEGIKVAGVIHDLGKINVPAEILSKPGTLSQAEFDLLKGHPQTGYDILKGIDFPWPIAQIVLQHHERLDGSGYPRGLVGEEMLIEAKILAVADVVEAMTSHRPYRPAPGVDVALAEIEARAGRLYDDAAVQACLRLFRERGFTFD